MSALVLARMLLGLNKLAQVGVSSLSDRLGSPLAEIARRQFETGGAYLGKPWADYSSEPKYAAYKKAIGADMRPLRWQPGKREIIAPALSNTSDANRFFSQSADGVQLGVKGVPYLQRIQEGGVNQFGERFPARPILPDSQVMRSVLRQRLQQGLSALINKELS